MLRWVPPRLDVNVQFATTRYCDPLKRLQFNAELAALDRTKLIASRSMGFAESDIEIAPKG
jgi:hypothetical protein